MTHSDRFSVLYLDFFKNLLENPLLLSRKHFSFQKFLVVYNKILENCFYHFCSYLLTSQEFEKLKKTKLKNLDFFRNLNFFLENERFDVVTFTPGSFPDNSSWPKLSQVWRVLEGSQFYPETNISNKSLLFEELSDLGFSLEKEVFVKKLQEEGEDFEKLSGLELARFRETREMPFQLIQKWNLLFNQCLRLKSDRDFLLKEIWMLNDFKNLQFSSFIFLLTLDKQFMLSVLDLYCFHAHMCLLKDRLKIF
jgi:hypothetical protein